MCVCVCTLDNMFSQNNGKIAICCSVVCFCLVFFFLSNFCLLKAKQDCVLTMTSLKKKSLLFAFAAKYQYFFLCVCVSVYVFYGFFFFSVIIIIIILIIKKLMCISIHFLFCYQRVRTWL